MFLSLLVVVALCVGIIMLKRWQKLPKEQQKKSARQILLWSVAAIVLALVVTGRAHWLMGVLATLLALAGRVAQFAQYIPMAKKIFGDANAQPSSAGNTSPSNQIMTRQEAADILGIDVNASQEEVRMAHKKLMQKIHPDRGGSDALAKQINEAKKVLSDK